jgi:hypothetical protein
MAKGTAAADAQQQQKASSEEGGVDVVKRVRVRKLRSSTDSGNGAADEARAAAMDRRIAEIIPGIADISISNDSVAGSMSTAREIRRVHMRREQEHAEELRELSSIYDMRIRHPMDDARPSGPWQQEIRPKPRRIVLSQYQYEMINYQRMLLRKNIWYYR